MPAATHDIKIEENAQFDFYITKEDSECNPTDITGYGAKFQVRSERLSTSAVIYEATVGGGITIPTGTDGLFIVSLTVTQVNSPGVVGWEKGHYDFVFWPSGGSISDQAKRLVEGRVTFKPAAVHP
jgi:hypothetical protein